MPKSARKYWEFIESGAKESFLIPAEKNMSSLWK